MEDLARYLDEVVEPTIEDFAAHPTSVRHAFLACVAVFHSVDYLAYPKNSRAIRNKFRQQSSDFALIDKVAHAFKHVFTGPPLQPDLTAKDVISRPPAVWGQMVWDLSRWDDADGGVTLDKDRDTDLLSTVRAAAAFLKQQTKRSA